MFFFFSFFFCSNLGNTNEAKVPRSGTKETRGAPTHLSVRKATLGGKRVVYEAQTVWGRSRSQCPNGEAKTEQEAPGKKQVNAN